MAYQDPFELFKTLFRIQRHMQRFVSGHLPNEVTPLEMHIIHFLKHQKTVKTSELAEHLGIPGSTLTGILDRMEKRELIERSRDQSDRRVVLVRLGAQSKAMRHQLEDIIRAYFQENAMDLPPQWWDETTRELKKLEQRMAEREEGQRGRD